MRRVRPAAPQRAVVPFAFLTFFCLKANSNDFMPHTAFNVLLFPNVSINWVNRTIFSDKRGTTIPCNSWNSKDAKRQRVQRRETSTSSKGLCRSFTSPWNDVGVWHLKRDQRGSRISIHLHHSQLITGNLWVIAISRAEECIASIVINVKLGHLPTYHLSELVSYIGLSANGTRQFCRTKRAAHDQTIYPAREGSVWPGTALSSTALPTRRPADQFWKMASVFSFLVLTSYQE